MKPILFNTEMVRAIQNGTKTVTRRLIKLPYYIDKEDVCRISGLAMHIGTNATHGMPYPDNPYHIGDTLYVRETFAQAGEHIFWYKADGNPRLKDILWRPSIHMPKEAARIFLRVTDVRIERLQDITEADAVKEGAEREYFDNDINISLSARTVYSDLWNSTVKKSDLDKYGWDANPWVTVNEFRRISKEEALNESI